MNFDALNFFVGMLAGGGLALISTFLIVTNFRFQMDNLQMDLDIERDHSNFLEEALTRLTVESEKTTRGKRK